MLQVQPRPDAATPVAARQQAVKPGSAADRRSLVATAALYLTSAVVVLAPLPFGSVETLWVGIWCIPLALALPLFDLSGLTRGQSAVLTVALASLAILVLAIGLQTVPDPPLVAPNPIWADAEAVLHMPVRKSVSIDPLATWSAVGRPLVLALALCCGLLASRDRRGATFLTNAAGYAGAAYAFYGIVSFLNDPNELLGVDKPVYIDDLTGTFVNRNTAATFFGMILILWTVRLLSELEDRLPRTVTSIRDVGNALLNRPSREMVISALCACVVMAALLMTRSRAGVILTFGSLFVAGTLRLGSRLQTRAGLLLGLGMMLLIAGPMIEIFSGTVAVRIGTEGLVDQARLSTYASSLEIIRQYPWLGTGLGTFEEVFARYRNGEASTSFVWDRAHSTPIEIAVEMGLPVAAAVVCLWVAGLAVLFRSALQARRGSRFVIMTFGIALLGSLHAMVDFSPQVPGFAIVWMALLGCGLAQALPAPSGQRSIKVAPAEDMPSPGPAPGAAR